MGQRVQHGWSKALKRAKKRLKKTRQRLDWRTGEVDFVVRDDVASQTMWEDSCFSLDLYSVDGVEMTKAEALQKWLRAGHPRERCLNYVNALNPVVPSRNQDIPDEWRSSTLKRLRQELNLEDDKHSKKSKVTDST